MSGGASIEMLSGGASVLRCCLEVPLYWDAVWRCLCIEKMSGGASVLNPGVRAVWIIIIIIIYWIDFSLGNSSYTSTDKTNKNKYT